MKTYNRSLDLAAAALECLRTGKGEAAAKLFAQAAKHPSVASAIAIIDANNQKAFEAARKVSKPAKARAGAKTAAAVQRRLLAELTTDCEDAPIAGDELRVELDSQESMPEVQEGAAEDDLDEDDDKDDDMTEARFRRVLSNLSR